MKKILNVLMLILFVTGTILLSWNTEVAKAAEVFPFNGIINADSLVVYKGTTTDTGILTELSFIRFLLIMELLDIHGSHI